MTDFSCYSRHKLHCFLYMEIIQDMCTVNFMQITQHAGQSNDLALERHVTLLTK